MIFYRNCKTKNLQYEILTPFYVDFSRKSSKAYIYLGTLLDAKMDPSNRNAIACGKEQRPYCALKINKHPNPSILSKPHKRVIFPSVLYNSELWCNLRHKDILPQHLSTLYL